MLSLNKRIGVNITAFGRKLTLFKRHPAFNLKCHAFFAYFELEKMRSIRSASSGTQTTRQSASSARQS